MYGLLEAKKRLRSRNLDKDLNKYCHSKNHLGSCVLAHKCQLLNFQDFFVIRLLNITTIKS